MPVLLAVMVGVFMLAARPSWAYEEITVADGGTITGKVTISGDKPTPKGFNLVTFPDPVYCGRISTGTGWRILDEFTVGPDGSLKDVVVLLTDVSKGKPFLFSPQTIEAKDCRFLPFVTVVRDKSDVVVMNMDPVFHDIQGYETSQLGPRVLFNTPLPMNPHHRRDVGANSHEHLAGEPMKEVIHMTKGRRIFVMQCGFHAYMESWGWAVDNPYYAMTAADGTFTLPEVPPGEYTLVAWHPQAGPMQERKVSVGPKQSVTASFEFKTPTGRRSAHEIMENPHFGPEALGRTLDIRPTLELQKP